MKKSSTGQLQYLRTVEPSAPCLLIWRHGRCCHMRLVWENWQRESKREWAWETRRKAWEENGVKCWRITDIVTPWLERKIHHIITTFSRADLSKIWNIRTGILFSVRWKYHTQSHLSNMMINSCPARALKEKPGAKHRQKSTKTIYIYVSVPWG